MSYVKLNIETDFENNTLIPIKYTKYGENISPEFKIKNLSKQAKSLAIILEDLDHPLIKNFTHWTAWNIKASDTIPENIGDRDDIMQGIAYGFHKYAGNRQYKM